MEDLETGLKHFCELTPQEIVVAKKRGHDLCAISILKGLMRDLSENEKERLYKSIKRKIECNPHFNAFQNQWMKDHRLYVDHELIENHLDHSPDVIDHIMTDEFTGYSGENFRCRVYYAMVRPKNIEKPYSPGFSNVLRELREARRTH